MNTNSAITVQTLGPQPIYASTQPIYAAPQPIYESRPILNNNYNNYNNYNSMICTRQVPERDDVYYVNKGGSTKAKGLPMINQFRALDFLNVLDFLVPPDKITNNVIVTALPLEEEIIIA